MEFCDAGSLDEAIQQGRFRSGSKDAQGPALVKLRALCLTLLDIALAMAHLHSMRIVHKDLKPKNVLLATCAVWHYPVRMQAGSSPIAQCLLASA